MELLQNRRKNDGPKSAVTASVLAILGLNRLKQEKYVEAEPILRECLAIREQQMPDNWLRYNTLSMLGDALLGQQKYADAEPLLLEGYEALKHRESQMPPVSKVRLTEAADRLVRFYEMTNQPDKAGDWRRELERVKVPPGNWSLQPEAIGAAVEVTKPSEPSMERIALAIPQATQAVTRSERRAGPEKRQCGRIQGIRKCNILPHVMVT